MNKNPSVEFSNFVSSLQDKRLGVVYSSRFEGNPSKTWYHRWRSDIIGLYSSAAEVLGMEPTFFNVDQFLELSGKSAEQQPDFIINLNAGNRFLGNLSLVPSIAQWRRIPTAFCDARTAIVSEDKRLSKMLAMRAGMIVPKEPSELTPTADIIIKPVNLGSSVGVSRATNSEHPPEGYFAEEFVRGLDGTIVLILDCTGTNLFVPGAQLVLPDISDQNGWIYTEEAKQVSNGATSVEYIQVSVSKILSELVIDLAHLCGSKSVARVDVRYTGVRSNEIELNEKNSVFIEYNAMPTLGRKNSVNEFVEQYIHSNTTESVFAYLVSKTADKGCQAAAYLLSSALYKSQLQMK